MEYRNELKFLISDFDMCRINYRLRPIMDKDEHQGNMGYLVRSVYFDDIFNSYMSENESGIDCRKKYRIRIYDGNAGLIHLEKKAKYRGMTKKVVTELTKTECDLLLTDNIEELHTIIAIEKKPLLKEVYHEMLRKRLEPKCIVEYERFAFVERLGNVRITFDRNISASKLIENFFSKELNCTPIMPCGYHILEIKYDEFLPRYILQAVDIKELRRQSYSKYYSARKVIG